MTNNVKALILTAAVTGFFGGTSTRLQAQPTPDGNSTAISNSNAGLLAHSTNFKAPKHSCKGQNNCKGQGGCKSSDNGCKGKNSCKGKGGCATDGSKMPD